VIRDPAVGVVRVVVDDLSVLARCVELAQAIASRQVPTDDERWRHAVWTCSTTDLTDQWGTPVADVMVVVP
jgi:hypothetical protein